MNELKLKGCQSALTNALHELGDARAEIARLKDEINDTHRYAKRLAEEADKFRTEALAKIRFLEQELNMSELKNQANEKRWKDTKAKLAALMPEEQLNILVADITNINALNWTLDEIARLSALVADLKKDGQEAHDLSIEWQARAEAAEALVAQQKEQIANEHELFLSSHRDNMKAAAIVMEQKAKIAQQKEQLAEKDRLLGVARNRRPVYKDVNTPSESSEIEKALERIKEAAAKWVRYRNKDGRIQSGELEIIVDLQKLLAQEPKEAKGQ